MDVTTVLTGVLPAVVFVSAILTAIVSAFLLWLYRRATLQAMDRYTGTAQPPGLAAGQTDVGETAVTQPSSPLIIKSHVNANRPQPSAATQAVYERAAHSLRSAAVVYTLGGLSYALILTVAWLITAGGGFVLSRFGWLFICYAWPIVLVLSLVTATSRRACLRLTGGYFVIVVVIAGYVRARNPELSIGQLVFFWFFTNAAGTALLLAFLQRRVRAVGPLVLGFIVVGVTGAMTLIQLAGESEAILSAAVTVGAVFGLEAATLFWLIQVIGFVVFSVFGWRLLGWIGQRYQDKRVSDQSLTIDALWLLFGVVHSITLAFEGWAWIFTGLVAWSAYKLVTCISFTLITKQAPGDDNAPLLLLLRVFALGRRSAQFFDAFSKWWRRAGSMSLIAGPDLATTTLEPHEFLAFVSGRLARQFVTDETDLDQRLVEIDRQADPDGRYRVNEFFCQTDTWQITMRRLAQKSDAVLMDLRSFTETNQGCLYELEQLLNIVDLQHVVFLVDETTDTAFLEKTLQRLWPRVDHGSPNRHVPSPTAHFFQANDQSEQSLQALLFMLLDTSRAWVHDRILAPGFYLS